MSSANRFNADQVHYLLPGARRLAAGQIVQASAQHMGALSELLSQLLPCTPKTPGTSYHLSPGLGESVTDSFHCGGFLKAGSPSSLSPQSRGLIRCLVSKPVPFPTERYTAHAPLC